MDFLKKVQVFVKEKIKSKKNQQGFVEFTDFFVSENIVNFFGLTSLPSRKSFVGRKWKEYVCGSSLISLVLLAILSAMSMIIAIRNNGSLIVMAENVCGVTGCILMLAKVYAIFYYHRDKIDKIVTTLETYYPQDNWNQRVFKVSEHLQELKNHEKVGITFYTIACILYLGAILVLQIYNLITSHELGVSLILQLYTPFDQTQPYVFVPLNIIALISINSGIIFLLMTDLLYAEFVALTAMELKILGKIMSEIEPADDQDKALDDLKKLVKVHEDLIEVFDLLEQIFSPILFINLFEIIAMMCSLAFMSFAGIGWLLSIRYSFLFLSTSWNAYNACLYGSRLSSASSKVAEEAYNGNWIDGNRKYHSFIQIIMARSQKEQVLTGLNFLDANLETFTWIANLTYSYYSVLVALYNSE